MALLNDDLTVWEIGFRWAGFDPDRRWWHIPLPVRDNFRNLIDAIWNAHLDTFNVSMEKQSPDDRIPAEFFIRHHTNDIQACISGESYP